MPATGGAGRWKSRRMTLKYIETRKTGLLTVTNLPLPLFISFVVTMNSPDIPAIVQPENYAKDFLGLCVMHYGLLRSSIKVRLDARYLCSQD